MPRFFVPNSAVNGGEILIEGADVKHITKVLRHSVGDELIVCDMRRCEYTCRIAAMSKDAVRLHIMSSAGCANEPTIDVTLYQALCKGDKMDAVIQKAVELGVSRIVPYTADRCVALLDDPAKIARRLERWQKIADEAAKQCGRGAFVQVAEPASYAKAISDASASEHSFLCFEGDTVVPIRDFLRDGIGDKFCFIIGPEGGFSACEIDMAKQSGVALVGLGKRILRTETASGAVLAVLMYLSSNL